MKKAITLILTFAYLFILNDSTVIASESKYQRNYTKPLSSRDKKDITTIVKALAWDNHVTLGFKESSLKKAGDRIDPIHPLKFLEFAFTNDELKAGMHAIRSRTTFIWANFWNTGLKKSLEDESKAGNLTAAQIADFSKKVGVSPQVITPAIHEHRWLDFFDLLLTHIPRNQNAGRYDM